MWNVEVLVSPRSDGDKVFKDLESAGWNIRREAIENGSVRAHGAFSTPGELGRALQAAQDAPADFEPVDMDHIIAPDKGTEYNSKVIGDLLGKSGDGAAVPASSKKGAPTPTGLPAIPDSVWSKMEPAVQSKVAKELIEKWVEFTADRRQQAAWAPSREAALLAHLEGEERSKAVRQLLAQDASLSAKRVEVLAEAVLMSGAIREQFSAWTSLAGRAPRLLVLSTIFSSAFIGASLYLVSQSRLNGSEMGLLAFIFTLAAISPATLLLIGRPLAGLDKWTPDAMFKAGKAEDTDKDQTKPGVGDAGAATTPGAPTAPPATGSKVPPGTSTTTAV